MKPLPTVSHFIVAMLVSFAALAQYPGGNTDLIVPGTQPSDLRRVTASIFASALHEISEARIKIWALPYSHFKVQVSPSAFYAQDGSQLALTTLDSSGSLPDFMSEVTVVALLARADLALFVKGDSNITVLNDFATSNNREPLVVSARTPAARFAARRTFETLGVPIEFMIFNQSSQARRALESRARSLKSY